MKTILHAPRTLSIALAASFLLASCQEKASTSPASAPTATPTATPSPSPSASPAQVAGGEWKSANGVVSQTNGDTPALLLLGDNSWKDYTLELEAQKTDGDEGFLIAVRAKDDEHLIWFNVGGWGNTRTAFENLADEGKSDFGESQTYAPFVEVQTSKWHQLKVSVAGNKIEGFLDGKSAARATGDFLPAGKIAIGTWSTQAQFRNIKVTSPDGRTLWEGTPSIGK